MNRPKFSYFPFGGGPRMCIGHHFATTEAVLGLAAVLSRFRFSLATGSEDSNGSVDNS